MDDQRTDREGGGLKRFSIRDLFWLTAIVAILTAWWAPHRPIPLPSQFQIVQLHKTRHEVLVYNTRAKQYYVWQITQVGEPLSEAEGQKWDRTK
jgi:hypothetical protein